MDFTSFRFRYQTASEFVEHDMFGRIRAMVAVAVAVGRRIPADIHMAKVLLVPILAPFSSLDFLSGFHRAHQKRSERRERGLHHLVSIF